MLFDKLHEFLVPHDAGPVMYAAALKKPVKIVAADADVIRPFYAPQFYRLSGVGNRTPGSMG